MVAATGGLVVVAVGHRSCALTAEAGERPRRRSPSRSLPFPAPSRRGLRALQSIA